MESLWTESEEKLRGDSPRDERQSLTIQETVLYLQVILLRDLLSAACPSILPGLLRWLRGKESAHQSRRLKKWVQSPG